MFYLTTHSTHFILWLYGVGVLSNKVLAMLFYKYMSNIRTTYDKTKLRMKNIYTIIYLFLLVYYEHTTPW